MTRLMNSNRIFLIKEFRHFLGGDRFTKQKSLYGFTTYFLDKFELLRFLYTFSNNLMA
jgi:hypothetical protein